MKKKANSLNIAIILGFYNGKTYIFEQLESIVNQSKKGLNVFIFCDHCNEKLTKSELNLHNKKFTNISIIERASNFGFAKNFLQGLKDVGTDYDYYAFSDQDDIWENNKIEEALKEISKFNFSKPVLYCSRTAYFSNNCSKEIGSSRHFKKGANFKNALIQNIAGGNTIVMNKEARNLVVSSLKCREFVSHDWWCYQLISAAGGEIIYSSKKSLKYRQHDENLIGSNKNFKEKFIRLKKFFSGSFKIWVDINIDNLKVNKKLITESNMIILKTFIKARESKNIFKKLALYLKSGVYRQTFEENIIFLIGLILDKI